MSIGTTLTVLSRLAALSMLPLLAFGADERSCWMRDAALPTNSTTYALCEQGTVLVSTDGGSTWSTRATGAKAPLRAIAFLDVNRGFVVGDGGALLATEDAGKTWQARPVPTNENLMDIQMAGEQGWVAGFGGSMLHSADGGRTWNKQDTGIAQALESLFFLDAQHGWAVGWAGTILRTTNGGQTWQQVKNDAASWSLSAVYFRDEKNGWIVGFAGQLLRSRDGGATWEARKSPVSAWLTSVVFDSANRGWITTDDGLLVSEDGGDTWRAAAPGERLFPNKLLRASGAVWAIGPFGMMKQTGTGMEWKRIENPLANQDSKP